MVTAPYLKQIMPGLQQTTVDTFMPHLNNFMPMYEINNFMRQAAFLAQLAHESGSFRYMTELASGTAYEGRADLGNVHPGDGVKFKGRGLIQITGRNNYGVVSKVIFGDARLLDHPELLATPQYAVQSACWYWKDRGLNEIADQPDDWSKSVGKWPNLNRFQYITLRINGGLTHYDERLALYKRALTAASAS